MALDSVSLGRPQARWRRITHQQGRTSIHRRDGAIAIAVRRTRRLDQRELPRSPDSGLRQAIKLNAADRQIGRGCAVIKVEAPHRTELRHRKLRIEDALTATRSGGRRRHVPVSAHPAATGWPVLMVRSPGLERRSAHRAQIVQARPSAPLRQNSPITPAPRALLCG